MLRAMGMFGLAFLFLVISPSLRGTVMGGIQGFTNFLDKNSPLSYVGVAVVILAAMMVMVYRAAQPR